MLTPFLLLHPEVTDFDLELSGRFSEDETCSTESSDILTVLVWIWLTSVSTGDQPWAIASTACWTVSTRMAKNSDCLESVGYPRAPNCPGLVNCSELPWCLIWSDCPNLSDCLDLSDRLYGFDRLSGFIRSSEFIGLYRFTRMTGMTQSTECPGSFLRVLSLSVQWVHSLSGETGAKTQALSGDLAGQPDWINSIVENPENLDIPEPDEGFMEFFKPYNSPTDQTAGWFWLLSQ